MQLNSYTSFDGHRRLASGPLQSVAIGVKRLLEGGTDGPVLIFDDGTGRSIDIDTRGTDEEVLARLPVPVPAPVVEQQRGRGRPKLGVVAREVTLLPRHWDWLATQPGGASVTLRKLVEEARRQHGGKDAARRAQERAYHFMSAMAGDMPGFEEASRALFANESEKLGQLIAGWPGDVREHLARLASIDSSDSVGQ
ncbi:MAG: DUF2239 family protein [Burkholderiaceae bacterium]|nr:DUF2239 family protein [Burkholderiaceae bacterium]